MKGDLRISTLAAAALVIAFAGCSTPRLQPREGYVAVPGGRVWFKVVGTGPGTPLLVLHGGPGATSYYLEPLAVLGNERSASPPSATTNLPSLETHSGGWAGSSLSNGLELH